MRTTLIIFSLLVSVIYGCRNDFLDLKPDKKLIVPRTLDDYQALLDDADLMNRSIPFIEEAQADDYFISLQSWESITSSPVHRNGYIWARDIYGGVETSNEWNVPYAIVYRANVVLDGLKEVNRSSTPQKYDEVKAQALFFRAIQTFRMTVVFAPAYQNDQDNSHVAGVPLKLNSDLQEKTVRANLEETLNQVIADLTEAERLFTSVVNIHKTRPSQMACWALLSRVHLYVGNYQEAERYANLVLADSGSGLIDFADLDLTNTYPFSRFNQEVIFHSAVTTPTSMTASRLNVDTVLYDSYDDQDLRKNAFFRFASGRWGYRGSYDGSSIYFNGLTIGECYLTIAECLVRRGEIETAAEVLSSLLNKRGVSHGITPTLDNGHALEIVLRERRKEMVFKGVRWMDLKRLNRDRNTATVLYRHLGDDMFELVPGSANYVFPIPPGVIQMAGIEQSERD